MVGKEKLVVYGESVLGDIEATVVGNFNGVLCVFGSFGWGL